MNWVQKGLFALLLVGLSGSLIGSLTASAGNREEARELREKGAILPLEAITERAHADGMERLLEVELESDDDHHVYEIEALDAQGVVRKFNYDAVTGERLPGEDD